ncbi:hypothetical protein CYMTET_35886, partial [Cymbomonas tetramitiformis]
MSLVKERSFDRGCYVPPLRQEKSDTFTLSSLLKESDGEEDGFQSDRSMVYTSRRNRETGVFNSPFIGRLAGKDALFARMQGTHVQQRPSQGGLQRVTGPSLSLVAPSKVLAARPGYPASGDLARKYNQRQHQQQPLQGQTLATQIQVPGGRAVVPYSSPKTLDGMQAAESLLAASKPNQQVLDLVSSTQQQLRVPRAIAATGVSHLGQGLSKYSSPPINPGKGGDLHLNTSPESVLDQCESYWSAPGDQEYDSEEVGLYEPPPGATISPPSKVFSPKKLPQ